MPLRLQPAITVSSKRILRVAGARPLPFAAIVGRDGGSASIESTHNGAAPIDTNAETNAHAMRGVLTAQTQERRARRAGQ